MFLFEYFWSLAFVFMCANLAFAWPRMKSLVRSGHLEETEVERFAIGTVVALAAFCGALQVVVLTFGSGDPFCFSKVPWDHPLSLGTYGITFAAWGLLLSWVWIGRGATTLSRMGPAFRRTAGEYEPHRPMAVRLVITLMIALAAGGHFYVVSKADRAPDVSCVEPR